MLISIVIPVYNGRSYIADCLNSIFKQTWSNFEIIISDDSEDNETFNELEKIRDPRVHYLKNISGEKGIFSNLNNAIKTCQGDLIQIFCQDDMMYKNFLFDQMTLLKKYPDAGIVFSQFDFITENNEIYPLEARHNIRKEWPEYIPKDEAANFLLRFGCMPGNLSPVMLKKSVLNKIGYFNQDFPYAGDFEYWVRMAGEFSFAYNANSSLAVRRHPQQASNTLGKGLVMLDRNRIYSTLLEKNTSPRSKHYKQLYINQEIGVQQLYFTLKNIIKGKLNLELFKHLNTYPLNIFYSFVLMFITVNGRFKPFKL